MHHGEQDHSYCYFHPKEKIIGVCAPCLKERLLVLASKQRHHKLRDQDERRSSKSILYRLPSATSLPKVFALGSLFHRLELRRQKPNFSGHSTDTSTRNEDSFISIKFEDNGRASWDKGSSWTSSNVLELPSIQCLSKEINVDNKSVVEHAKSRTAVLRWRKRIGHLLQLVRWRRSNGANMGTKVEAGGVKGRKGWMRAITKRKTRQETAFSKA